MILGLSKIENLNKCRHLRALYLHENCIFKIENLLDNKALHILNLSCNMIEKIEGLGKAFKSVFKAF